MARTQSPSTSSPKKEADSPVFGGAAAQNPAEVNEPVLEAQMREDRLLDDVPPTRALTWEELAALTPPARSEGQAIDETTPGGSAPPVSIPLLMQQLHQLRASEARLTQVQLELRREKDHLVQTLSDLTAQYQALQRTSPPWAANSQEPEGSPALLQWRQRQAQALLQSLGEGWEVLAQRLRQDERVQESDRSRLLLLESLSVTLADLRALWGG